MTHTCRNCKRTFTSELQYELHQDVCTDGTLICACCGEQFSERRATRDGWHYACPNDDCDGEEIGEDLHAVTDFSVVPKSQ